MPFKKRASDGGFDFYVDFKDSGIETDSYVLQPGEVKKLSTGVHCRFPKNTVWQWDVRSSVGLKGIIVSCRTVDQEYLGCLHVVIVNSTQFPIQINDQERLSQLVPNPFSSNFYFQQVATLEELGQTSRAGKGFGSSGK